MNGDKVPLGRCCYKTWLPRLTPRFQAPNPLSGKLRIIKIIIPLRFSQPTASDGRAYSHRIPLAGVKCLSEKRLLELAGWLGGEPASARRVKSPRYGYRRPLFRFGA